MADAGDAAVHAPPTIDFREQGKSPRELRYNYRALEFIEQATDCSMMTLFTRVAGRQDVSLREIRILLQAGMLHKKRDLDAATVQDLIDEAVEKGLALKEIMVAILTALMNCKVLVKESAADRPPKAGSRKPGPKSSKSPRASRGATSASRRRSSGK